MAEIPEQTVLLKKAPTHGHESRKRRAPDFFTCRLGSQTFYKALLRPKKIRYQET
jgi:hypothetical protein